jgi:hypothetical protein
MYSGPQGRGLGHGNSARSLVYTVQDSMMLLTMSDPRRSPPLDMYDL